MSLNSITLSGHLGADAELRSTQSGITVCQFSLAITERRKQRDGSFGNVTHWIDCVIFGKRGEGLHPYLRRGSKLSLLGHLTTSSYERDGRTMKTTSVVVDDVELQNSKASSKQTDHAYESSSPSAYQSQGYQDAYGSDDIPF